MTAEALDQERAVAAHLRTEWSGQAAHQPAPTACLPAPPACLPAFLPALLESRPICLETSFEQENINNKNNNKQRPKS